MKTKTQLKNTNSKRSIAMKKSWAERRNSPGRKLAQERQAKKVTQRVTTLTSELKDIGTMLAQIGMGVNEVRSMVAAPPSNGALAHSVEVSKRLEDYKQRLGEGVAGIYRTIKQHVDAFDQRLNQMEQMRYHRNEAIEQRIAKLEEKPPVLGTGNAQGVWMDRAYVKDLEKKAAELAELKKPKGRK